jgi:hypothetical protein
MWNRHDCGALHVTTEPKCWADGAGVCTRNVTALRGQGITARASVHRYDMHTGTPFKCPSKGKKRATVNCGAQHHTVRLPPFTCSRAWHAPTRMFIAAFKHVASNSCMHTAGGDHGQASVDNQVCVNASAVRTSELAMCYSWPHGTHPGIGRLLYCMLVADVNMFSAEPVTCPAHLNSVPT